MRTGHGAPSPFATGTAVNGAKFVHFLLGPATVALGVPTYTNFELVRCNVCPLAAALLVGAIVAIASSRSGNTCR
jgi:putative effector of murein hydrolase